MTISQEARQAAERIFDPINGPLVEMENAAFDHMTYHVEVAETHIRILEIIQAAIDERTKHLQEALKKSLTCGLNSDVRELVVAALKA